MESFRKLLAVRKNNDTPVHQIPRRTGKAIQQQIDVMMSENEQFKMDMNVPPKRKTLISSGWLQDACSTVPTKIPISNSTPQLGYLNIEQINYLADPDRMRLVNALALAAVDICKLAKKKTDTLPIFPNRILITSQGTAVVVRYHSRQYRLTQISNKIEKYLDRFSLLHTNGHPLLSDRIPRKAIAIRWDGGEGVWFKRVRYLYTIKIYDYFLEYETGSILELRWDLTRFFYLPDSFDRDYSALRACQVDYDEPHYDNFYMKLGQKSIHQTAGNSIGPIVVGKEHAENGSEFVLDRLPTFRKHSKKSVVPIRRVRSEEDLSILQR